LPDARRLVSRQRGLRLRERCLRGPWIDLEQQLAGLDVIAILDVTFEQLAVDEGFQRNAVDRLDRADARPIPASTCARLSRPRPEPNIARGGGADEQAASNALAASPAAIGKKRQCFRSTMLWRRVVPVPANYR
jgi:hypothetical protein